MSRRLIMFIAVDMIRNALTCRQVHNTIALIFILFGFSLFIFIAYLTARRGLHPVPQCYKYYVPMAHFALAKF